MMRLQVQIMGQSYNLTCPEEDEALIREAVRCVREDTDRILESGKLQQHERIAVLVALNAAFDRLASAAAAKQGDTSQAGSDAAHAAELRVRAHEQRVLSELLDRVTRALPVEASHAGESAPVDAAPSSMAASFTAPSTPAMTLPRHPES
ncbi:cell division protein ZapA [Candidatus Symbiobacter mobilis]|uniref:Cell division protein ZapA n=1 Tax=Candidatus Symbiobacter mobilis CR TaxID=946483 RepID=U5N3W0_9BURK|nr:cell division protein ZapA [Candidatus Symbiobacter mobilis]AGX86176.1 hypothetical protein Cenrod_0041 [Candidatus Symbiobacter mobilis CR]